MDALRNIPAVDELLREVVDLRALGPDVARWIVRRELRAARERVRAGSEAGDVRAQVAAAARSLTSRGLRRVVNATGVMLHTNLGRAPLSDAAREVVLAAAGAATVEYDVTSGERGSRAPVAATLAAALCDAEDALIVNNNAGALMLALAAIAKGREVIVSRGELIEIGGEFRLPDVMEASGAHLREVGTTNRTHLRDYERALSEETALILKVHPSNYEIVGFTTQPPLADLVGLARAASVPVMFDIGSGLLGPEEGVLGDEPDARSAIATGVDLVCFSGDKLLGGPQAGVIAGRSSLVEACRRHPIARAVRADKLTLAAMEATLWQYARGERASVPVWRMLETDQEALRRRVAAIVARIPGARAVDGEGVTGGGSVPGRVVPSVAVEVGADRPDRLARHLRLSDPPVIARVERGTIVLDLRTVQDRDDEVIVRVLRAALDVPVIRPARDDEASAIAELQVSTMRAAYRGIVADGVLDSFDIADFTRARMQMIPERRALGGETFVAVVNDRIAGFTSCGAPRDPDLSPGVAGELYAIYATWDRIGSGIGRALIAEVERYLAERGCAEAVLWVFEENARARRFYERAGYQADGMRKPNPMFGNAVEVRYRKSIDRGSS